MSHTQSSLGVGLLAAVLAVGSTALYACGDDTVKEPPGAGSTSGNPPASDAGKNCFDAPKTHFEIINACTDATGIEKNPVLPKLLPDGGLPPLK